MAIYVYTYSGFPDETARKYYVCNFRKGKAHTYQVVPQLQRTFDRLEFDDKTPIDWEQFKQWRRRGHLYTRNRSGDRTPLYGSEGVEPPERWREFSRWLSGSSWPGEVDWSELGRQLRTALTEGAPLPERLARQSEPITTEGGDSLPSAYEALRRCHLERVWFHRARSAEPSEWATLTCRALDRETLETLGGPEQQGGPGVDDVRPTGGSNLELHELVRESRPPRVRVEEEEARRELGETLEMDPEPSWSAILEQLGPTSGWYERSESESGRTLRVPTEQLYDLQWVLRGYLTDWWLHHSTATACEVSTPQALHARFHAGAAAGIRIRLAEYPQCVGRERLERELRAEARSGVLANWSESGVDVLVRLLVAPELEGLSPGSPSAEVAAESSLWSTDEELRLLLEDTRLGAEPWRYSRLRDEIVVSSTERVGADMLSEAVALVTDGLRSDGFELAEGGVSIWRAGERPLLAGGLAAPKRIGGTVRPKSEEWAQIRDAAARLLAGEAVAGDRARARRGYAVTGDVRFAALGDPEFGADVRSLLRAVGISNFQETLRDGWFGEFP